MIQIPSNIKQIRPPGLGKVSDAHVTAAVIIEMVHLATLVHDDVIDEADVRRGRAAPGSVASVRATAAECTLPTAAS